MKNKVLKTVVVIMLIIAMTLTDLILIGMNIVTYATDNANSSGNVEFAAYFKTDGGETAKTQYEINNKEMKLYMKVSVESGVGFDGVITLENSNFKFKEDILSDAISKIEGNTITLNRVRAGKTAYIEVGIEALIEENYEVSMLSKESTLKLTGNHIKSEEESASIDEESKVTLNLLVPSNIEALTKLETKVITNKIYLVGTENKRIVQIEVKSEVLKNVYPIKNTTFELVLPEGMEGLEVISKGTYLTNGEAEKVLEEATHYVCDQTNKLLQVRIQNESKEGKVSWSQDGEDNIIVTLILNEAHQLGTEEYDIKSNIEFYGSEAKTVQKEFKYNLTQEADGIIGASIENKEEIYKGKIYSKEEREYNSTTNIEVNYANLIEGSTIEEKTTYKTETEEAAANVQYKQTTISKLEFDKVLGTEVGENGEPTAELTIKDQKGNTVKVVKVSDFDTTGIATITYEAGVTGITVEITKAVATGIIRLNHTKVIKAEEYEIGKIKTLKTLAEQAKVTYTGATYTFEMLKTLLEPVAEVGLTVTPGTITAEESNDMQMAITLKTDNEKYELYQAPIFKFTMPEGVTVNSVSQGTISATDEEMAISRLETNGKEIILELTGGQQKYVTSDINPQIIFKANVSVNKLMANKQDSIKMEYLNKYINEEKVYELKSSPINIIASNSRIVTNLKLENYNGLGTSVERYSDSSIDISRKIPMQNNEIVEVPVKYTIINNDSSEMALNTTIVANYTDKEGNIQELINYTNSALTVAAGSMQVIEQVLQIPAELYFSEKIDIQTETKYTYSGTPYSVQNNIKLVTEEKEGIRKVGVIDNKIQLETFAQLGDGTGIGKDYEIYNEQIVTYIMQVTNVSDEPITNLTITNKQTNGNIYDLKEEVVINWAVSPEPYIEHIYGELETNTKTFEVGTLNPGETKELMSRVVAKKVEPDNITTANISVSADGIEEQLQTLSNKVKDAELKVSARRAMREEVQLYGDSTYLILANIKNLSNTEMTNAKVKIYLSEGLKYRDGDPITALTVDEQVLNIVENITYNEQENYIELTITTLSANQEIILAPMLYIEEMPIEETSKDVTVYLQVNDITSNNVVSTVKQIKTQISVVQTTNIAENQKVQNGEKVIITADISNIGNVDSTVSIQDQIPEGLEISKVTLIQNNQEIDKTLEVLNNNIYIQTKMIAGEKVILRIEGIINTSKIVTETIENVVVVKPTSSEEFLSNTIILNIESNVDNSAGGDTEVVVPPDQDIGEEIEPPINTEGDDEELQGPPTDDPKEDNDQGYEKPDGGDTGEGDTGEGDTGEGDTGEGDSGEGDSGEGDSGEGKPGEGDSGEQPPEEQVPTHNISGNVWVDKNGNGTKENNEGIKEITIKIVDINNQNTFLKDINGKEIEAKTNEKGEYNIENIEEGKYSIIFKYDTSTYELKQNSNVKDYIIESTNEKVAITENINLNSNQIIDLELVKLKEFDLKIDKYINKVVVQTVNETKTSNYTDKKLVKEEIQSKYLSGANVLVEYEIKVTNIGELSGYATEIIDYMPESMTFHSELNTQWYKGEDGNLYNTSLESTAINPGESKSIKLVLLKTMTKNNTGTTANTVEIAESINNKGYADIDLSNNQSKAEIIVNPATGRIITYIVALLNGVAIIVLGMYIIKKKVVGKGNI